MRDRPLWMLIPGGALMVLVIILPLLIAAYISLLDLDQYSLRSWLSAPFVGFANYVEAVAQSPLLGSIWISVSLSVLVCLICLPLGVAAAVALQNRFRGRGLVRSVLLIPYVLPAFAIGAVWRTMLQSHGVVNTALASFGIDGPLWLNGPASYWVLVAAEAWCAWPFVYLLTLSALQSIEPEVYEAAALDGAGTWQKLTQVILPQVTSSIALAMVITFLHIVNSFSLPFVLFGVPTPDNVQVMPILTYIASFQSFRFGLSAAIAVSSLVIIAIPLFVYIRAVRLDVGERNAR